MSACGGEAGGDSQTWTHGHLTRVIEADGSCCLEILGADRGRQGRTEAVGGGGGHRTQPENERLSMVEEQELVKQERTVPF